MQFYITDVFGSQKYSGNQLATFVNCAHLSSAEMQQIAREINFSETTFITSTEPRNGGFDVRIFTPGAEVDFAGHPTIGTAYIIQKYILKEKQHLVKLNLKVGQIPVELLGDVFWMQQVEPIFGETLDTNILASVLQLSESDFDTRFPIQEVSTGLPFTIVPLKSMESLKKAIINLEKYNDFITKVWAKGILVFCPEGYSPEQHLGVRVFVNYVGIPEDPATGSGCGFSPGNLPNIHIHCQLHTRGPGNWQWMWMFGRLPGEKPVF
jgi:trans-2,3-dihydro-3-hydroxyanthranilate isomerase